MAVNHVDIDSQPGVCEGETGFRKM